MIESLSWSLGESWRSLSTRYITCTFIYCNHTTHNTVKKHRLLLRWHFPWNLFLLSSNLQIVRTSLSWLRESVVFFEFVTFGKDRGTIYRYRSCGHLNLVGTSKSYCHFSLQNGKQLRMNAYFGKCQKLCEVSLSDLNVPSISCLYLKWLAITFCSN